MKRYYSVFEIDDAIRVGDWVRGIGLVSTYAEQQFLRRFAGELRRSLTRRRKKHAGRIAAMEEKSV